MQGGASTGRYDASARAILPPAASPALPGAGPAAGSSAADRAAAATQTSQASQAVRDFRSQTGASALNPEQIATQKLGTGPDGIIDLRWGLCGHLVKVMQQLLNKIELKNADGSTHRVAESGQFDNSMIQSVRVFQQTIGIPATGVIDFPTRQVLRQMESAGSIAAYRKAQEESVRKAMEAKNAGIKAGQAAADAARAAQIAAEQAAKEAAAKAESDRKAAEARAAQEAADLAAKQAKDAADAQAAADAKAAADRLEAEAKAAKDAADAAEADRKRAEKEAADMAAADQKAIDDARKAAEDAKDAADTAAPPATLTLVDAGGGGGGGAPVAYPPVAPQDIHTPPIYVPPSGGSADPNDALPKLLTGEKPKFGWVAPVVVVGLMGTVAYALMRDAKGKLNGIDLEGYDGPLNSNPLLEDDDEDDDEDEE
jgi:peptidoglycan hydrolase-like protein with peptidoglycan-binding domain